MSKKIARYMLGLFLVSVLQVQTASAMTISPARMELGGDPGTSVAGEIELFNEEDEVRTLYSETMNFEASGEGGGPVFVDPANGIGSWIEIQESVIVPAGERVLVPFLIRIPSNAAPGGHFGSVLWTSVPPDANGQTTVSLGSRIASLILFTVSGDIQEKGGLTDFGGKDGKRIFTSLPVILTYRFTNDGNDRIFPAGEVRLKNIFGRLVRILDPNRTQGNVLPGSTREFEVIWDKEAKEGESREGSEFEKPPEGFWQSVGYEWTHFAFGPYTTELVLSYGKDGQLSDTASFWFFVFPWHLISIVILVLVISVSLVVIGLKRYKRSILAQIEKK